jgi:hypothetical protein
MSFLSTKPNWFPSAIATDRGWINPVTGELLISIKNLRLRIESEQVIDKPIEQHIIKEVKMEQETSEVTSTEVKQKRAYNKKPKVIGEAVERSNKNMIAEVVEYNLETPVIGE